MTEEEYDELRPSAFAIAYRMLGSVSEAEDLVQEGFLRLHRARESGASIESPRAFLSTVVSRLSLDQLRSARARRETYVGDWLPEPLTASADDDPARKAEMADSLSLAFLVLLESLSPEQRAAFLLREVFDEPYDQIAEIIGTSEQNARQLAARARLHVEQRRPRFESSPEQREQLATRFFAAAEEGDLEALEELLAHDVVLRADGGGKAPALAHAVHGRARAARTLTAGLRALARRGITYRRKEVNGQPGALFTDREGKLISVMILDVAEGQIQAVNSIINPDKLRHLGPLANLHALLHERALAVRTGRASNDSSGKKGAGGMAKFVTIAYGDQAGYNRTDPAVRDAAHEQDAKLRADGAVIGIAGQPVQVRNPAGNALQTARAAYLRSELPVAGFALIEAADIDEAIALVAQTPCAVAHGVVEVWPLEESP